ncbi:MAG TPA: CpaD family pilus assembly protein [Rhizomicrobium sp.]
MKNLLRYASVAAMLLAGSCASPLNQYTLSNDGAANHPITVEAHYNSIKLPFSAPAAGLLPDDAARLDEFVARYLERGNGALSISAPAGRDASAAIGYFGERLASLGVDRSRIMVGTHQAENGDSRVEIGFVGYVARTDPCGDWSKDLSDTAANQSSPNFGCATQHNIAAMVADPRDLVQPRPMAQSDAVRRGIVVGKYEKGEVTAADKSQDQSGKVSGVVGQ